MERLRYPAKFIREEDGEYLVWLPDINGDGIGIYTQGATLEEARRMAQDALTGSLLVKHERGGPLDEPGPMPNELGWEWVYPDPHVEVALLIRELRHQKGLTQKQAAEMLAVPYTSLQRWEDPEKCNATVKTLERIARAFGRRLEVVFR